MTKHAPHSLRPDPASLTGLFPTRRHPVSLLHTFAPLGAEGQIPWTSPVQNAAGNFYGQLLAVGPLGWELYSSWIRPRASKR
jgi:hypothetical protein